MQVAFYSNFLNEHQIPFCDEMYKQLDGKFYFIATEPMSAERLELGFKESNDLYPYVVKTYEDKAGYDRAMKIAGDSDVVLIGSAPNDFIAGRLEKNQLTFRYCERFFDCGRWRILDPRVFIGRYRQDFSTRKKNLHMLCAGAYTAPDCRFIFSYPRKTYKWGYFTEVKDFEPDKLIASKKNDKLNILWCSRFIKLKHPEAAVRAAEELKKNNINFHLDMIGCGELEEKIKALIKEKKLEDFIGFPGSMSPAEVRTYMEKANVFLFTSDSVEGWGAVLGEAMASGCAVVANSEIGAVPFLLKDGENGFIYKNGSIKQLCEKLLMLANDETLCKRLGKNAYITMRDVWSPKVAAERLIKLSTGLLNGKMPDIPDGPCSRA